MDKLLYRSNCTLRPNSVKTLGQEPVRILTWAVRIKGQSRVNPEAETREEFVVKFQVGVESKDQSQSGFRVWLNR